MGARRYRHILNREGGGWIIQKKINFLLGILKAGMEEGGVLDWAGRLA